MKTMIGAVAAALVLAACGGGGTECDAQDGPPHAIPAAKVTAASWSPSGDSVNCAGASTRGVANCTGPGGAPDDVFCTWICADYTGPEVGSVNSSLVTLHLYRRADGEWAVFAESAEPGRCL